MNDLTPHAAIAQHRERWTRELTDPARRHRRRSPGRLRLPRRRIA